MTRVRLENKKARECEPVFHFRQFGSLHGFGHGRHERVSEKEFRAPHLAEDCGHQNTDPGAAQGVSTSLFFMFRSLRSKTQITLTRPEPAHSLPCRKKSGEEGLLDPHEDVYEY